MAGRDRINKFLKFVDPALRVPFVFAMDWFFSSNDSRTLYSLCTLLSALVIFLPLLLIANHGNLLFIYGFWMSLDVIIIVTFFTIGEYFSSFQDFVFIVDRKKLFLDGLIFYQVLIFTLGIDSWLINHLRRTVCLTLSATVTVILWKLNYGCMLAFWFFMSCEFIGMHKKLKQSLNEASYLGKNLGYLNMFVYYYRSKRITLVLQLFWLLVFLLNFLFGSHVKFNMNWMLICIGATSNTNLRLFGLALWLPEISYIILWISRALLTWSMSHTADDLEPQDMGKALVFYFIASFNSVLDVDVIQRVFFLALMLFISCSYILQSVFKLCDETLKALSTSLQRSYVVHVRAVLLTLTLVWVLLYASWIFCTVFYFQVWQLVVVSSNIVTAVQATSSLAVYALFLYDLYSMNTLEQLDDWVYYLKATSNTLEFASALLVLSFGIWDVLHQGWNVFGLVVMVIHTYYNVWLTARHGWKVFLSRRTAVTKLNRLADATPEQLKDLQDFCAICFERMSFAKITHCGHYFHANCLRKWLYVQSSCPLCHQDVIGKD